MSDLIIKKNGTDYKLPMLAEHYPADRVYLDGDINKTVQDVGFKLLWENQNPTTAFDTQTINLSSADYDLLLVIANVCKNYSNSFHISEIVPKLGGISLNTIETSNGANVSIISRTIMPTTATALSVNVAQKQTQGSSRATNNDYIIPYQIYGIKI